MMIVRSVLRGPRDAPCKPGVVVKVGLADCMLTGRLRWSTFLTLTVSYGRLPSCRHLFFSSPGITRPLKGLREHIVSKSMMLFVTLCLIKAWQISMVGLRFWAGGLAAASSAI